MKPEKRDETIREVCLVAGFLLLIGGIWMIYPPAALITGGVLLMAVGLPARRAG